MDSKKSSSQQLSPTKRREIVQKELNELLDEFLNADETVNTSTVPLKYAGLGKLPFQQKSLVDFISDKHPELECNQSALTAQVQRTAKKLKAYHPAAGKIIRYNPHKESPLGSPHPSRISNKKILKKLNELDEFKRKFENLLTSGRPEPEKLQNEEAE